MQNANKKCKMQIKNALVQIVMTTKMVKTGNHCRNQLFTPLDLIICTKLKITYKKYHHYYFEAKIYNVL